MLMAPLVVLALGEMTQSSRYYEYISRLAPPGQQGLYMGYAFLPIAIGYFIAGPLGGYLLHEFGDVLHRPAADVVGDRRHRRGHGGADVALRQDRDSSVDASRRCAS